jgi:hypothetical protein
MPQPDVGDLHVNALLTDISIAHLNKDEHYVADRMFPLVGVEKQSDLYQIYTRGTFFQGSEDAQSMRALLRAPGTRAPVAGYALSNASFRCDNFAVGVEIADEQRGNADAVFNLDREATILATQIQQIRRERAWATDFMKTGVWGTDKTVANKWSDYGASDPFTDLEDGLDAVEAATGDRPNKFAMGAIVWRRLKHHPDLVDRIKGGATTDSPALVQRRLLASILEIEEVLVARASYRSSAEGAASLTMARIIDDDAILLFATPTPGLMTPTAGVTFFWRPLTGGALQFMRKYRMEPERKDVMEAHSYLDQVATETESGYFFTDVVD